MYRLDLTATAERDIEDLLVYTVAAFGEAAKLRYQKLIGQGLLDIANDPLRPGSVKRDEFGGGMRSFHLMNSRSRAAKDGATVRRPRHVVFYRVAGPDVVAVARILHDAMDFSRHLPPENGET